MSKTSSQLIHAVLTDPCASHWLKHALETAIQRDILDASRDADQLAGLLQQRYFEMSLPDLGAVPSTLEGLQELKAKTYKLAQTTGIINLIGKVARALGERVSQNYGPKYRFTTDACEVYVDDYGNFMTVKVDGKLVCSTHNEKLFVPGPWVASIHAAYLEACAKITATESENYTRAFRLLAKELGFE